MRFAKSVFTAKPYICVEIVMRVLYVLLSLHDWGMMVEYRIEFWFIELIEKCGIGGCPEIVALTNESRNHGTDNAIGMSQGAGIMLCFIACQERRHYVLFWYVKFIWKKLEYSYDVVLVNAWQDS